jgi:hypothetical protein
MKIYETDPLLAPFKDKIDFRHERAVALRTK